MFNKDNSRTDRIANVCIQHNGSRSNVLKRDRALSLIQGIVCIIKLGYIMCIVTSNNYLINAL